jgi:hypothetical protein
VEEVEAAVYIFYFFGHVIKVSTEPGELGIMKGDV